jgi:hypothetical protein
MRTTAENLRYLLWRQKKVKRRDWIAHLSGWGQCDRHRAEALLNDEVLLDEEQERIAQVNDISVEDLQNSRFVGDNVNILHENIKFLTDKKYVGEKLTDIEKKTGIGRVTLTRWRSEDAAKRPKPEKPNLDKLSEYFGLPVGTDLRNDPVFLTLSPVGPTKQREWVHKRIDRLTNKDLRDLFQLSNGFLESNESN